jgi:hypothetical protein
LRKGNRKERAARFQVLDWAMQEPLKLSECDIYLYGKGAAIPVRVRYEDGTEETLAASWIGENHGWGFFHMALWNDWARLLREGGEIPHRDLKIRALKDTLPELWFRELRQHAPVKGPGVVLAPLEPIDAADFAERSKGFRQGEALSFPGLPPAGFVRISEHPMDREKLGSGFPPGPAGAGARQCLGFGMAAWMNTWHSTHLVSVDGVTDFGGEEWFYARVPKEMPPPQRNAIYWPVFAKRINDYAAGLYRKQAILQVHYDLDYSPANMMRYTQGMDAVFLCLTVVEGRNQTGGIAVPLLEASDDGSVTLGGFGQVLTAKIAESKDGHLSSFGAVKGKLPAMEVVITGAKEPAMKKLKNVRLLLESNFQDGIIAVTPFVRGKAPVVPRARKPAPVR